MNLLLGAITEGFILAPLTLGLYLSYRVYDLLDLTADGSFGVGAATVAALLVRGVPPIPATLLGTSIGCMAGGVTGLLYTRLRINASLAGVLTTTALYSVMLFVMGGGNLSLAATDTLASLGERIGERLFGLPPSLTLFGTSVDRERLVTLALMGLIATALALFVTALLRTELGLAMRAVGSNRQMARAVAVDVDRMIMLGLGLSNGIIALSGALFAQYVGFANIQMGVGSVVTGMATLMVGEALLGIRPLGRWVASAVAGAVVFRLLIAGAIRLGLDANALKLVTALLVLLVLSLPRLAPLVNRRRPPAEAGSHA